VTEWDQRQAEPGPDGRLRCPWALGSQDYLTYHDTEWGRPVRGDVALLERLVLEGFQSGLSWLTILRKRPAFRAAFAGFDPQQVAEFTEDDVQRLLGDAGIVRHRGKIEAAITNARALRDLQDRDGDGALDRLMWCYAEPDADRVPPVLLGDLPSRTASSAALAAHLKRLGFTFVGPTTVYAAMQACGLVDDHLDGCIARAAVSSHPGDGSAQDWG
jgi:DNA-3-methyladenine glycosylase I